MFEKGIEKIVKWYLFSKITPSLFVDKASCTRQFESKLSLHSLASLFPLKEGSTSHLGLLPSGKKRETALLGARNRYALRLADHQRSSPFCAGWDRMGMTGYSLYPGNLLITCRFPVNCLVVSRKKRNFGGKLYKLNNNVIFRNGLMIMTRMDWNIDL